MENTAKKKRFTFTFVALLVMVLLVSIIMSDSSESDDSSESTTPIRNVVKNIKNSLQFSSSSSSSSLTIKQIKLSGQEMVVLSNGILEATFSNPGGDFTKLKYKGISNLFESRNKETNRGYWDFMWSEITSPGHVNHYHKLNGLHFNIIRQDEEAIEISFVRLWNESSDQLFAFNIDKRFIILRGHPGIYSYVLLEHSEGAPPAWISFIRAAFKLDGKRFRYMALSDDRRRKMPSEFDRAMGEKLAFPEAVHLVNSNNGFRGEVDDKYQYSADHKDIKVHGWISSSPKVGFWIITPSQEITTAGPLKQELTNHVGPTCLSVLMSCHYVGRDLTMRFEEGEKWKKMYGPIAIYLNSVSSHSDEDYSDVLWKSAKRQARKENLKWPYKFIKSQDYPSAKERGSVTGQLYVEDRYANEGTVQASFAYVGLAAPGEAGSWQLESKGYQFWVKADKNGAFKIRKVRPGIYGLFAFVDGFIGNYVYEEQITVEPGVELNLGTIVFRPPRNGPTLWEIGYPDRTAAEYFIPDPLSTLTNSLLVHQPNHKFRQYGLWDRYTDLYPNQDIVFVAGVSDYRRDWFYAHVNRKIGEGKYESEVTWQVKFSIESVNTHSNYTLQLAIAGATGTDLQVRFNDPSTYFPMFRTHLMGRDNVIARHGIHGVYRLFSVGVPGYMLQPGVNILYLTQARSKGPFGGLMYDYLRFEAPETI